MARERVQRKSFQQSLEDIKEKMKEKRNSRLASASAPNRGNRGRSRMINKSSDTSNRNTILKGVQLKNKALAVALQAEKEKVRQANGVILQLKREQHALFLHLILLKRKLKEQVALVDSASEKPTNRIPQTQDDEDLSRRSQNVGDPTVPEASPACSDLHSSEKCEPPECDNLVMLPSTVGVRRRRTDRSSRSKRRSERVQEQKAVRDEDPGVSLETLIASPICSDERNQNQMHQEVEPEIIHPVDAEQFQHSTPELIPAKKRNQQQPSKKQPQQEPRTKPEPAQQRKPDRGRKAERAPLKKPWDNPKPRTRSKSRDRSATRAKAAPPQQGNKLNTSLGFNDTFDFDCEEAVHITPFKAKAEERQPATPISEEMPQTGPSQSEVSPADSEKRESSSSSPSSESEDSLYVPQKTKKRHTSPERTKVITTRRGRLSKRVSQKENVPPKQEIAVFRDEELSPEAEKPQKEQSDQWQSPNLTFNSPDLPRLGQENPSDSVKCRKVDVREGQDEDCLPSVSPLVEAEMMRIDTVLSNFGDSTCEPSPLLLNQTPQRAKPCKKRALGVRTAGRGLSLCDVTNLSPAAYRKFSCGGSRPSDARCSTPVPSRKRRCTMVVDYKEPSLSAKLRRGDKFTDLQFLRSPIFKQKSGRRSVQRSRNSMNGQQPFEKYNESFVGCL
ncbi:shugoshin 1 [Sphaeramia orbicularis]|uniref:Shugoshin C-terminal domain-containing protein n=1 Tax=Sphaeramia orbicularis TaxID=375764 RepID=A0A672YZ07_9TELE|nr:shugoshin 1 [Sphaeramia orbicularis]